MNSLGVDQLLSSLLRNDRWDCSSDSRLSPPCFLMPGAAPEHVLYVHYYSRPGLYNGFIWQNWGVPCGSPASAATSVQGRAHSAWTVRSTTAI